MLGLYIFLVQACVQANTQFKNNGTFTIPAGYRLVQGFQANAWGDYGWLGYIIESPQDIVIAFRASATSKDVKADIDYPQVVYPFVPYSGYTHKGFTSVYSACRNQIIAALRELPPKTLYITGHSLGGALAVLNAIDVAANTHFTRPIMVNFGAPRVGNPAFAATYNYFVPRSIRVVNVNDAITNLPFKKSKPLISKTVLYYQHVGHQFSLDFNGSGILGDHKINNYLKAITELASYDLRIMQRYKKTP